MSTKTIQGVIAEDEAGVRLVTLNDPDRRNALSVEVHGGLLEALSEAEADDSIHCVVITGAGSAFCAGGDVVRQKKKAGEFDSGERPAWYPAGTAPHYSQALRAGSKPVIAAVNGASVGAGMQIALLCDIRIASEKARFGAMWIARALDAAGGAAYLMPRSIGLSNTFYMLYSGELIGADMALQWQLVTKVLPPEQLLPYTLELARKIASQPVIPMSMNRRIVYRGLDSTYETMWEWAHAQRMICYKTEDHMEASKAFLEKRKPVFKGK